jgi:hypothetical protein
MSSETHLPDAEAELQALREITDSAKSLSPASQRWLSDRLAADLVGVLPADERGVCDFTPLRQLPCQRFARWSVRNERDGRRACARHVNAVMDELGGFLVVRRTEPGGARGDAS